MGHRKWSFGSAPAAEVSLKELEREHGELYDEWKASERRVMETLDENNRLDRELDEARKRIAELEVPTRVPFTDAQIDAMARAARETLLPGEPEDGAYWPHWLAAQRAALAAGGLEPCAVPQYEPDDVALRPSDTPIVADLHKQLEAARREVDEVRRHISVTMRREHQARKETGEAKQQADEYLRMYENEQKNTEHWKAKVALADATVSELRDEVDEDNAAAASVNDLLVQVQNLTAERDALRERAAVAPTDDQVEALARVFRDEHAKVMGTDALSYGLTVFCAYARVAIAHLSTRPEGLPTADELLRVYAKNHKSIGGMQATLDYLRPWLRDPVGWELDVTADVIEVIARSSSRQTRAQEILDLCRSRTRPVYECKECAKLRDDVAFWKRENVASNNKMLAARAALEGE